MTAASKPSRSAAREPVSPASNDPVPAAAPIATEPPARPRRTLSLHYGVSTSGEKR